MLQPKRTKFRKSFRLRGQTKKALTSRGATLSYGEIGIKATTKAELTARQIEAARRTIARTVKRGGKVWIRVFPDKVLTSKGAEVPMGSGKGAPDKWVAPILPGKIIFEMSGAEPDLMRKAMKNASYKLACKTKIVTNEL